MKPSGWKKEPLKFSDYSYERIYGAPGDIDFGAFERPIDGLPVIYQGTEYTCVACAVAWIRQYQEKEARGESPALSHQFLAKVSNTAPDGATPTQVLKAAKNVGICESKEWALSNGNISVELELAAKRYSIEGFAFIHNLTADVLHAALLREPIMVGVDSYQGSEPHMMVGRQTEKRGDVWGVKTVNWDRQDIQGEGWVPFHDICFAATIPAKRPEKPITVPKIAVLRSKWAFLPRVWKFFGAALLSSGIVASAASDNLVSTEEPPIMSKEDIEVLIDHKIAQAAESRFGSAGVYNVYSPSVSESGVDADDDFLPVSTFSLSDNSGGTVTTATIRFPVYLVVNPRGTNRETFECNALSTARPAFINCDRAITCNNLTNSTSTISGGAYPHAAGEPVIMSNDNCFFNRFTDVFTTQDIGGTKTFTTSTILIGDDTTSTAKFIRFPVNQGNEPYFKVVGPATGRTTSTFFFSVDGSSDLELNASGTTVGASSTRAIGITEGLIHWNPSSTAGLAVDSGNTAYVVVSSTASADGGFMDFLNGRLYWRIANFLSGAWTWTGNQTINAVWTFTAGLGRVFVPTPTDPGEAANMSYVDSSIALSVSTGTAGVAISSGQAIYISTTGTLFLADADATSTAETFVGISQTTTGTGGTVSFTKPGGVHSTLTGLTAGLDIYLSGTAGSLTNTRPTSPTLPVKVGRALSSTRALVLSPTIRHVVFSTFTDITADQTENIGVTPDKVIAYCGNHGGNHGATGEWEYNRFANTSSTLSMGSDTNASAGSFSHLFNTGQICRWIEGASTFSASIIPRATGFTFDINATWEGAARDASYIAEYNYP